MKRFKNRMGLSLLVAGKSLKETVFLKDYEVVEELITELEGLSWRFENRP